MRKVWDALKQFCHQCIKRWWTDCSQCNSSLWFSEAASPSCPQFTFTWKVAERVKSRELEKKKVSFHLFYIWTITSAGVKVQMGKLLKCSIKVVLARLRREPGKPEKGGAAVNGSNQVFISSKTKLCSHLCLWLWQYFNKNVDTLMSKTDFLSRRWAIGLTAPWCFLCH